MTHKPEPVTITHVRPSDVRQGTEYGNYCICGNKGEPASYVFLNTSRNAIPKTLRNVGQPGFISWDGKGQISFIPAEFPPSKAITPSDEAKNE